MENTKETYYEGLLELYNNCIVCSTYDLLEGKKNSIFLKSANKILDKLENMPLWLASSI